MTTGIESVEQYIAQYGFCNWQAQEVIQQRDKLKAALELLVGAVASTSIDDVGDAYYEAVQVLKDSE